MSAVACQASQGGVGPKRMSDDAGGYADHIHYCPRSSRN